MSDETYGSIREVVSDDSPRAPILEPGERFVDAAGIAGPSGRRISGISKSSIDENGFIVSWGPVTFSNDEVMSVAEPNVEDFVTNFQVTDGVVGIYEETIEGSSQYNWDLASDLGKFKLYSPIQDFSSAYPYLGAASLTAFNSELSVMYDADELEALANKFGTLPTDETAKSHIISKTQQMAAQIALKRKKKLTFNKASNNYKLVTSDFYSIQTSERAGMVSVDITSTTGSFNRPADNQFSGRVTYTSLGPSTY